MIRADQKYIRELVTPEGVTLHVRRATYGARVGAFAIDLAIMLLILIVMTIAAAGIAAAGTTPATGAIIWILGFFLLRNFYFAFFESGGRAATPGKRVLKIRVAARDGGRLNGGAVIARNLLRELEMFLPPLLLIQAISDSTVTKWTTLMVVGWTGILLLLPLFNKDRLRAGDLIAGTWVVVNERPKMLPDLLAQTAQPAADALDFTPEQLDAYGQAEVQRLADILQNDNADQLVHVAALIRQKINHDAASRHVGDDRAFLSAYYAAARRHLERKLLMGKRKRDKFDRAN